MSVLIMIQALRPGMQHTMWMQHTMISTGSLQIHFTKAGTGKAAGTVLS